MRLVDKDWLLNALGLFNYKQHGDLHFINGIITASEIIDDAETVELIKCEDCRYREEEDHRCRLIRLLTRDYDFCSYAEIKEEE